MVLLNIACGGRYNKDWINIDFQADSEYVQRVNLLGGLPFKDNSIDVAYSSHFLEHIDPKDAKFIIDEIYRILKPKGIIRIVVPDLENTCKEYLNILKDDKVNIQRHEWITIELFDQMVRNKTGGKMREIFEKIIKEKNNSEADYILERTGDDLLNIKKNTTKGNISFSKIINAGIYIYLKFIRLLIPKNLRDLVFINTSIGEKHRWMYDRISLKNLLKSSNFNNIVLQQYNTSMITHFNKYELDIKKDGTPYKGNSSLYIEGIK